MRCVSGLSCPAAGSPASLGPAFRRPASKPNIGQSQPDTGCGWELVGGCGCGVLRLLGVACPPPLQAAVTAISDASRDPRGMRSLKLSGARSRGPPHELAVTAPPAL